MERINRKPPDSAQFLLGFPLLLGMLVLASPLNITHVEGLRADFSDLVLEADGENGTYALPFTVAGLSEGEWVLVNATPPGDGSQIRLLSSSSNGSLTRTADPSIVEITHQEGFEADFSNLAFALCDSGGHYSPISHTIIGYSEGQWAAVALERAPAEYETLSVLISLGDAPPTESPNPPSDSNGTSAPPGRPSEEGESADGGSDAGTEIPEAESPPDGPEGPPEASQDETRGDSGGPAIPPACENTTANAGLFISDEGMDSGFGMGPQELPPPWGAEPMRVGFLVRGAGGKAFPADITLERSGSSGDFGIIRGMPVFSLPAGTYDATIRPKALADENGRPLPGAPVEAVRIRGAEISPDSPLDFGLENLPPNVLPFGKSARQAFAADPTRLSFIEGEIEVVARGTSLYKCAEWDFDGRTCTGSWEWQMDLVPGEKYVIALGPDDPAWAEYNLTYGAPRCGNASSPCYANSSLLQSRDTLATPEPNQPNTLDSCADGASGTYLTDESVENITITSLNGTTFNAGDTVNITATVFCFNAVNDNINFLYTSSASSPAWATIGFTDPCPAAGFNTITKTFVLDPVPGEHAVRVINQYNGDPAATCGAGAYDDNDDVAFMVNGTEIPQPGDAIIAYRSNTGLFGVNSPKIRFYNASGAGAWGSEIELPSAGSPVRWARAKWSPVSSKIVIVTLGDDGNLDGYACAGNCSRAGSWDFSPNIGNVWAAAAAQRRYDISFETRTGDLMLAYGVNDANTARDLAYKVLPGNSTSFAGLTEGYIDDAGHGTNIQYSWVRLDSKPVLSEEIALAGFDLSSNDVNAWIWNGTAWGGQTDISNTATATAGYEALAIRYAADGSKAMAMGPAGTTGTMNTRYWDGSAWSAISSFDVDAGDNNDVRWASLKADPATDDLQAVFVDSGSDLTTAYWDGSAWSVTTGIDNGLDLSTARLADFEWNLTGSVGRLVWNTDGAGTALSQRPCSPQCTGTTTTISAYAGTGGWVSMALNPNPGGSIRTLSARLNSNFDIGSFSFDGSAYSNYGDSAITADTTVSTFEAFSIAFNITDSAAPSVDFTPPTPGNGSVIATDYAFINSTATDNLGVDTVYLEWNGTNETMSLSGTSNYFLNKTGLASGVYHYRIWASDYAGNWNATEMRTLTYCAAQINGIADSPDPQGFGLNVTISANASNASSVLAGITPPGGSESNFTMAGSGPGAYSLNYSNWINGSYSYRIYANDSGGAWTNSSEYLFDLLQNLSLQVRTLKDNYVANETINITDPEFISLDAPLLTQTSFGDGWMPLQTDNQGELDAWVSEFAESAAQSKGGAVRVSARAQDPLGVRRVEAFIPTRDGEDRVPLALAEGSEQDGVWRGEWVPHGLIGKHFVVRIEAENRKRINDTAYVAVGDPPGLWILPSAHGDPNGQWDNEYNARDGDINTYASDNSNPGTGWGSFILFNLSANVSSDRVRVWSDYGPQVGSVDIDVFSNQWVDAYEGSIPNLEWHEANFTLANISAGRYRFNYTTPGYVYWLYEFQFYNVSTQINIPVVSTRAASSVEEATAVLHSTVSSDGGDECLVRFLYGNASGSYQNVTEWASGQYTGSTLGQRIYGLEAGKTYYFLAQVNNSAGQSNGSEQSFTAGTPPAGWLSAMGFGDPSGQWLGELNVTDDETSSEAWSYHEINDPDGVWSPYLYLNRTPSIISDAIRFNAKSVDVDLAEVEVYAGGGWVTAYNGTFTGGTFTSASFNLSNVSEARIRFRAIANNRGFDFKIAEFDFFKQVATAPENQSKLENHGPTNASCILLMRTQFWNGTGWQEDDVVVNETGPRVLEPSEVLKLDLIWNPYNYSTDSLSFGPGTYRIHASCRDNGTSTLMNENGSYVNATYNFTFDNAVPSVVIVSPANGTNYTLTSAIPIWVNATDPTSPVTQVLANVSNSIGWELVNLTFNSSSGYWEAGYPNTNYVGIYTVTAMAYDAAGNVNGTEYVQVNVIDDAPPAVALISPPDGFTNSSAASMNVTFVCNSTDNYDNANITLHITDSYGMSFSANSTQGVSGIYSSAIFTLNLTAGAYVWNCLAYDSSGNNAFAPANRTITIGIPNCPLINASGEYAQMMDYSGAPNGASPLSGYACVKIAASDVVYDCAGFGITDNGTAGTTYGILLNGSLTNVTVRNCPSVSGYSHGIYSYQSNGGTIANCTATNSGACGISVHGGSSNSISESLSHSNGGNSTASGYCLYDSIGGAISNSSAYNNTQHGFSIQSSNQTVVSNSSAYENAFDGFQLWPDSVNNTLAGNDAYRNSQNGFWLAVRCSGNNLSGNSAYGNTGSGFHITDLSDNNTLIGNVAHSNDVGFFLGAGFNLGQHVRGNLLSSNDAFDNGIGIHLQNDSNTTLSGNNVTNNTGTGVLMGPDSSAPALSSNSVCFNALDIHNSAANGTGSLDRCDSFMGWSENGHYGCEYSCSTMWHRFFGNVSGSIMLGSSETALVYSWNATGFNVYFADFDSDISWADLGAIGRNTSGGQSADDFTELDSAFGTASYGDNINRTYSSDGSVPLETRNWTVFGIPVQDIPAANSTSFATSFTTGILWDTSDGGVEFTDAINQSTVWMVAVNASAADTYGTYDFLVQIPETLSSYEGANDLVSVYVELQ